MRAQRRSSTRGLLGMAGFLALWELASRTGLVDPRYVPAPSTVATRLWQLFGLSVFRVDVVATVLAWLIAIAISCVVAIPLGLLLGSVPGLSSATSVVVEFLRPIPPVALVPLAIVALGDGAQSKIALAAFAGTWPIMFNVIYGLHEVDPRYVETARVFRTRRWRIAAAVRLPCIAPFTLTGIRLSAALSLIVIVSTEFLNGSGIGFGSYIYVTGQASGDIVLVITGTVLAGVLGYLVNLALVAIQRRWFAWSVGNEVP